MGKTNEWHKYMDTSGNFEFPRYLYRTISDLMKMNLDLGTLVCNDPSKLRAYKERVKSSYKEKWLDLASVLEFFEMIQRCVCREDEFCKICGGSRYLLSETLTADEIKQISFAVSPLASNDISEKLQKGLEKAITSVKNSE
jgi:hypothetical protein